MKNITESIKNIQHLDPFASKSIEPERKTKTYSNSFIDTTGKIRDLTESGSTIVSPDKSGTDNIFFETEEHFQEYEKWCKSLSISSKIIEIYKDEVFLECLIDKENSIYEKRIFPKNLFDHIKNLNVGCYILLQIYTRPGVFKIEIHDGKNFNFEKDFELSDIWEKLDNIKFDEMPKKK